MEIERIEQLVKKFFDGSATEAEELELNTWYHDNLPEGDVIWYAEEPNEEQHLHERVLARLLHDIHEFEQNENPKKGIFQKFWPYLLKRFK